ncbi:MAG: prepilin-type N-terminal cleavage/methylation domain-containing protein [bacterium]|nr:prepilin-type N-terminal cleavage/methylation domain-containing protein [bacterium]
MNTELRIKEDGRKRSIFSRFLLNSYVIIPNSSLRGFTIIETLVAIAVLLLAITAPLTIAERGLASAESARQEITAFYLAQEAVEYIRNLRDTNAINGLGGTSDWLENLDFCFDAEEGCGVDPTANGTTEPQIIECETDPNDCLLYQYKTGTNDKLLGLFGHRTTSGWEKAQYTRKVFVKEIEAGKEAKVRVTISWVAGALGSRTITVGENLLNWYVSPEEEL